MRTLFREPLFHFVIAATVIFVGHSVLVQRRSAAETTIVVTETDLERFAALYASEAGALPTAQDMRAIIADHVREQALAREARRLGLDQGDTIVDRRLAQKMTFLVSDLTEPAEPSEAVLRAWFEARRTDYTMRPRLTFAHVYFREAGDPAIAAVRAALNGADPPDWRGRGQPFMLQRQYGDIGLREVERLFGSGFAQAMAQLSPTSEWQGPVRSALGAHLVRLNARTPSRTPKFEEVRDDVAADWAEAERRRLNAAAIEEIVSRYEVEIEGQPS